MIANDLHFYSELMILLMMLIDVELPGMITEFHDTGGNG